MINLKRIVRSCLKRGVVFFENWRYFLIWNSRGNITYLTQELKNPNEISLSGSTRIEASCTLKCHGTGVIEFDSNAVLESFVIIEAIDAKIRLGANSTVNQYSVIRGVGDCLIGNGVRIGPHVQIMAMKHNFEDPTKPIFQQGISGKGIEIGDNVWIGANVCILDGVIIGSNCIIGAGTVVTKDVKPNSVVVGNPGKVIKELY